MGWASLGHLKALGIQIHMRQLMAQLRTVTLVTIQEMGKVFLDLLLLSVLQNNAEYGGNSGRV